MEDNVEKYVSRFEDFVTATDTARRNSENCRDYYNHKQWTDDEVAKLNRRKQAAIVVNRIQPKVDALKGFLVNQRTDPKAFPRTQKHEESSYAITDALRYVNDNSDFDKVEDGVSEAFFIEGTGACIVEIEQAAKGIEIVPKLIPWDRYYYDPHAREHDFSDSKYHGMVIWSDIDDAVTMFPDHEEALTQLVNNQASSTETFDDKPSWIDRTRKRIRICQEYCLEKGVWYEVFFTEGLLLGRQESPYLDEDGEPMCPIEAVTAYIDRDLQRYGPVHIWLDLQDEINHRRSKALHLLSVRQTAARRGAIQDVDEFKREFAKPDGHVEYDGEKGDFEVLPTGDMAQAQFALLEEAKREMDSISMNAQLSGERQGDLSGKAVQALQAGGMLELSPLMSSLQRWKRRVFRQIWYRIKQFWTEEKWIRVTDDYDTLQWVGLNYQQTVAQALQDQIEDEALPPQEREEAAQILQMMTQAQDPRLQQVFQVKNNVAELDVDIILDMSPDSLTIQDEQFQILVQLAASRPEVPFASLLKMSRLRDKDSIIDDMEQAAKQAAEVQQVQAQITMAKEQADIENKQAATAKMQQDAIKSGQEAEQRAIENVLMLTNPQPVPTVAI